MESQPSVNYFWGKNTALQGANPTTIGSHLLEHNLMASLQAAMHTSTYFEAFLTYEK
jgi:hypothetical protein